ncbi:uncharacterized protein BX663DRAFT_494943 [Cokeromyces recurvatus]|uniref:uncharacterized protein n=1 Tax=Cokeromyces recurvatus TaxID=90255 RepID=UPI00221FF859|nr:uncharacterized protein BX663DRAFT_494943 [Cokeromyces recurvatus]KAI7907136.1 hypothetical protein BX663DRAFT_494943 [Cokeromyces recurvatus]
MSTKVMNYTNDLLFNNNMELIRRKISSCPNFVSRKTTKTYKTNQQKNTSSFQIDKDNFLDLATAALEEVLIEEERTSIWRELMEAFLNYTGVARYSNVVLEQFLHSQDIIEKLAEENFEKEITKMKKLSFYNNSKMIFIHSSKEDPLFFYQHYLKEDDNIALNTDKRANYIHNTTSSFPSFTFIIFIIIFICSLLHYNPSKL